MNNTAWKVIGGAFTVGALLAGILVAWIWLRPVAEVQIDVQSQQYSQQVSKLVFSDFENSDVTVQGTSDPGVSVRRELRWTQDKPVFTETWTGDTLHVTNNCRDNWTSDQCSIRYTVRVPAAVAVEVSAASGDISIRDVTGELLLSTASGDITLSNVTGQVTAKAVSGDVKATGLRSTTTDTTSTSGDVDLTFAAAPQRVRIECTSGDVHLRVPGQPDQYRIDVDTVSGDRNITLPNTATAQRTIEVKTVSGDLAISAA